MKKRLPVSRWTFWIPLLTRHERVALGEITSLAAGGVSPSEIDSTIAAPSSSASEQTFNLTVPSLDHTKICDTSLSYLLVDPDVAGKRFLRRRNEILVPSKFLSPAALFMSVLSFLRVIRFVFLLKREM